MNHLKLEQFVQCFKSQFIFQNGKGGNRTNRYYTAYNNERKVHNDQWGMMVFIHTAGQYGFDDESVRAELKITPSHFEILKKEIPNILDNSYPDIRLRQLIIIKSGLVKNSIRFNHSVSPVTNISL